MPLTTSETTPDWLVFVCYRRDDGRHIAQQLFDRLHRKRLPGEFDKGAGVTNVLDIFLDTEQPGYADYKMAFNDHLMSARGFIYIATASAMINRGPEDHVASELRRWLRERKVAPIIIDPYGIDDDRYVPAILKECYPNANRIRFTPQDWEKLLPDERVRAFEGAIARICESFAEQASLSVSDGVEIQKRSREELRRAWIEAERAKKLAESRLGWMYAGLVLLVISLLIAIGSGMAAASRLKKAENAEKRERAATQKEKEATQRAIAATQKEKNAKQDAEKSLAELRAAIQDNEYCNKAISEANQSQSNAIDLLEQQEQKKQWLTEQLRTAKTLGDRAEKANTNCESAKTDLTAQVSVLTKINGYYADNTDALRRQIELLTIEKQLYSANLNSCNSDLASLSSDLNSCNTTLEGFDPTTRPAPPPSTGAGNTDSSSEGNNVQSTLAPPNASAPNNAGQNSAAVQ